MVIIIIWVDFQTPEFVNLILCLPLGLRCLQMWGFPSLLFPIYFNGEILRSRK